MYKKIKNINYNYTIHIETNVAINSIRTNLVLTYFELDILNIIILIYHYSSIYCKI